MAHCYRRLSFSVPIVTKTVYFCDILPNKIMPIEDYIKWLNVARYTKFARPPC